jgi:hypothetical protein
MAATGRSPAPVDRLTSARSRVSNANMDFAEFADAADAADDGIFGG